MKSYTDINQSKKLAEILPIESADMRYGYIAPYEYSDRKFDGGWDEVPYPKDFFIKNSNFSPEDYDGELPCWSLAALLGTLPLEVSLNSFKDGNWNAMIQHAGKMVYGDSNNAVDACYEMILKLYELKML